MDRLCGLYGLCQEGGGGGEIWMCSKKLEPYGVGRCRICRRFDVYLAESAFLSESTFGLCVIFHETNWSIHLYLSHSIHVRLGIRYPSRLRRFYSPILIEYCTCWNCTSLKDHSLRQKPSKENQKLHSKYCHDIPACIHLHAGCARLGDSRSQANPDAEFQSFLRDHNQATRVQ